MSLVCVKCGDAVDDDRGYTLEPRTEAKYHTRGMETCGPLRDADWQSTTPTPEEVLECPHWWYCNPSSTYKSETVGHITLCVDLYEKVRERYGNNDDRGVPPISVYTKGFLWKRNPAPAPPRRVP